MLGPKKIGKPVSEKSIACDEEKYKEMKKRELIDSETDHGLRHKIKKKSFLRRYFSKYSFLNLYPFNFAPKVPVVKGRLLNSI